MSVRKSCKLRESPNDLTTPGMLALRTRPGIRPPLQPAGMMGDLTSLKTTTRRQQQQQQQKNKKRTRSAESPNCSLLGRLVRWSLEGKQDEERERCRALLPCVSQPLPSVSEGAKEASGGGMEGGREGGFRLRLETCVVAHRELLHLDVVWLEKWKRRFPCSCIIDPLAE